MSGFQKFIIIIGRIFLSIIFLLAGINKIVDWSGSEDALVQAMNHVMSAYPGVDWLQQGVSTLLPWASVILVIAVVFELVGGLFVMLGMKVRLGAALLILFLIPTTLFFHSFWTYPDLDRQVQMLNFLRNLSILGGLLVVLAIGQTSSKQAQFEEFPE